MSQQGTARSYADAQTRTIAAAGATFAYRELGPQSGVPLVLLTHLGANLAGWDPRIVDGLAQDHRVIAVDYRGVGQSTGRVRASFEEMADDVVALIRALGHDRVDMFGLAVGGMVAQAVAARAARLIDRLILASAGPAGGPGLAAMTGTAITTGLTSTVTGRRAARAYLARHRRAGKKLGHGDSDRLVPPANATELRAALTLNDPKTPLFFTVCPDSGQSAVFLYPREFVDAVRDFLHR
jgi:alpha-beta hydrolase superfamily lysophospholipase